jgi:N utilization substance protein B
VIAVQTLYRYEIARPPLAELLDYSWIDGARRRHLARGTLEFASLLTAGCLENLAAVDRMIARHLQHWDIDRVARLDLSVLRLGVYCLLHQPEIPAEVTIDESVTVARQFGSDDSYRFVNGVLDSVRKTLLGLPGTVAGDSEGPSRQ